MDHRERAASLKIGTLAFYQFGGPKPVPDRLLTFLAQSFGRIDRRPVAFLRLDPDPGYGYSLDIGVWGKSYVQRDQ